MIRNTALVRNEKYSVYTQNNVFLKLENLQKSGSLKIRAFSYLLNELQKEGYENFYIASTGNKALALAYLCNRLNLNAHIVMPINTAYSKIKQLKDLNAEVVLLGSDINDSYDKAKTLSSDPKSYLIGRSDNAILALGYQGLVDEILKDKPEVDVIVAPVGEGTLIRGIIQGLKTHNHKALVYGVEPYNSASLYNKFTESNNTLSHQSIAESLRMKNITDDNYEAIKDDLENVIRVSDEELVDSFLDVSEEHKLLAEASGLVALAGVKYVNLKGKNIVCIVSGGNVDLTTMASLMELGLQNKGRIFTFATLLSDKPGELVEIATSIADNQGNIIGLKHNQLSLLTRQSKVELIVSVETFGLEHKFRICHELEKKSYDVKLIEESWSHDV